MVKHVYFKVNSFYPVALAVLGWIAFLLGVYIDESIWLKFSLLSTARVLP